MRLGRAHVWIFAAAGIIFTNPWAGAETDVGQVVVTATRTEMEIAESPQPISVITKETIAMAPEQTIPEIIQRAAGVLVTNNGPIGSITTANIRGSEAGQVLIMIDGRRINDIQNGQFDLSNLPCPKTRSSVSKFSAAEHPPFMAPTPWAA